MTELVLKKSRIKNPNKIKDEKTLKYPRYKAMFFYCYQNKGNHSIRDKSNLFAYKDDSDFLKQEKRQQDNALIFCRKNEVLMSFHTKKIGF